MKTKMKKFMTIRETAKTGVLTEYHIRLLVAKGKCPGTYLGKTFYVNVPMLEEMLDRESAETVGWGWPGDIKRCSR